MKKLIRYVGLNYKIGALPVSKDKYGEYRRYNCCIKN